MKKKLLFPILLILFSNFLFGQKEAVEKNKLAINEINYKIDSLLEAKNNEEIKILNERIKQATETISNQNSIISSFGTLYTIITIILALLGIALPILTYQFGIKPSQKALEEFEKTSKTKFDKYLNQNKIEEVNNAIKNLNSQDPSIKNNALNFLALNYHFRLDNDQTKSLLDILKNNNLDETALIQVHHILSNQKNDLIKKYFINYLNTTTETDSIIYYAIKFLNNYEYEDYKKDLANYLKNNKSLIFPVSTYFAQLSKSDLLKLFNDKKLVDNLDEEDIKNYKSLVDSYLSSWKIDKKTFKNTYFYSRINTYS
jgi:hypothetical protein